MYPYLHPYLDDVYMKSMLTIPTPQPQRPVRTLRVRVDENVPPTLPGGKTIHQRNKSSPALSTAHGAAGLKAPAKRTAFGDVSNTTNGVRSAKDDGAILLKQGVQVNDKPIQMAAEKKTTTFLKQASRPYSVSNLRGLLTGVSVSTTTEVQPKPAPAESNMLANSRKTLTKRPVNMIFKDVTLPAVQEPTSKSMIETQITQTSSTLTKPLSLPEVSFTAKQVNGVQSQLVSASDDSLIDAEKLSAQSNAISNEVEDLVALRSDGIYIDDNGNVQVYQETQLETEDWQPTNYLPSKSVQVEKTKERQPVSSTDVLPASHLSIETTMPYYQPARRAEPEEYWEEEDDENYEEEGYVTARSFRSRGENTTGGATTILFPQVNQKIKREIEAAKQLVEAERTAEEIEDECFDTSMVAEYGDEIFAYMKDLEVSMSSCAL
jgi:hypothetical protein